MDVLNVFGGAFHKGGFNIQNVLTNSRVAVHDMAEVVYCYVLRYLTNHQWQYGIPNKQSDVNQRQSKSPHLKEPHSKEPHSKEPHSKEPHLKEPHLKEPHLKEPSPKEPPPQKIISA